MRKTMILFVLCLLSGMGLFAQTTAPNGTFTYNDIQYWVGSGSNQTAFVIVFNDGKTPNALVWGYRYDGSKTFAEMAQDIAATDTRFFYMADPNHTTLGGLGYDGNGNDIFSLQQEGSTVQPVNNFFSVEGYDYDGYTPTEAEDRWSGGWASGVYFNLSNGGFSSPVADNGWTYAVLSSFGAGGEDFETAQSATYTAVPAPTTAVCDAPTGLNLERMTYYALGSPVTQRPFMPFLSWNENNGTFRLAYKATQATDWTEVNVSDTNEIAIPGLTPNTEYEWKLCRVCENNNLSEWTVGTNFTTTVPEGTAPNGIFTFDSILFWTGSGSNQGAVAISFTDNLNPPLLVWGVKWEGTANFQQLLDTVAAYDSRFTYNSNDGFISSITYTGEDSVSRPHGQTGGYWYLSEGMASNEISNNTWAGAIFAPEWDDDILSKTLATQKHYTAAVAPAPQPECPEIHILNITEITDSSALIRWDDSEGDFDLHYRKGGEEAFSRFITVSDVDTFRLSSLQKNTTYEVQVRKRCSDSNVGDWSEVSSFVTTNTAFAPIAQVGIGIRLVPNPATNHTVVMIKGVYGKISVALTDIQGRNLSNFVLNAFEVAECKIDLQTLSRGIYFVTVRYENGVLQEKLVVE